MSTINVDLFENAKTIDVALSESADTLDADITIGGGSGTRDHRKLEYRDAENQHPIESITNLSIELGKKMVEGEVEPLTNEEIENLIKSFV